MPTDLTNENRGDWLLVVMPSRDGDPAKLEIYLASDRITTEGLVLIKNDIVEILDAEYRERTEGQVVN